MALAWIRRCPGKVQTMMPGARPIVCLCCCEGGPATLEASALGNLELELAYLVLAVSLGTSSRWVGQFLHPDVKFNVPFFGGSFTHISMLMGTYRSQKSPSFKASQNSQKCKVLTPADSKSFPSLILYVCYIPFPGDFFGYFSCAAIQGFRAQQLTRHS